MKLASWNVNSLRVRLPQVLAWLETARPDVLALQELKMPEEAFPFAEFSQAGYSAAVSGQKTYNGVAILSRTSIDDPQPESFADANEHRRVLTCTIQGVRIINLYVPNGESLSSTKYSYKLQWLAELRDYLQQAMQHYPQLVVLGDFNIAPADMDVYEPLVCNGQVLCSDAEREAWQCIINTGLHDCFRERHPSAREYTWWDYRLNAFKRNMGLRIDHILASTAFMPHCTDCYIDKLPRSWERPSDHTPIIATFSG